MRKSIVNAAAYPRPRRQKRSRFHPGRLARRPASLTCAMRALKSLVNSCCLVPRLERLRSSTSVRVAGSGAGVDKGVLRTSVGFMPSTLWCRRPLRVTLWSGFPPPTLVGAPATGRRPAPEWLTWSRSRSALGAGHDQSRFVGGDDGLGPIPGIEFVQDAGDVRLHRLHGDDQPGCDL